MKNGKRGCLPTAAAMAGALLSFVWLLNLQMGVFLEIPDNLPIVGNLDEAFFTTMLLACLSYLGIDLPFLWKFPRRDIPEQRPPKN